MLLVPKQLQRVGMTGNVPYYGGRFSPAQAYGASHPSAPPPTFADPMTGGAFDGRQCRARPVGRTGSPQTQPDKRWRRARHAGGSAASAAHWSDHAGGVSGAAGAGDK